MKRPSDRNPNPMLSGLRTSLRAAQTDVFKCGGCNASLSMDGMGKGKMVDGRLLCARCLELEGQRKAASARNLKLGLMGTGAGLAILAVLLPGQAMFIIGVTGLLVTLFGIAATDMQRVARLALIAGGLVAMTGCVIGLLYFKGNTPDSKEEAELLKEAKVIRELLDKEQIAEARKRLDTFYLNSQRRVGGFKSKNLEKEYEEIKANIEALMAKLYPGDKNAEERMLIDALNLKPEYTPKAMNGQTRIESLKLAGGTLTLKFLADAFKASPVISPKGGQQTGLDDPAHEAARKLLIYLLTNGVVLVRNVNLDLSVFMDGQVTPVGEVSVTTDDLPELTAVNDPYKLKELKRLKEAPSQQNPNMMPRPSTAPVPGPPKVTH